MEVWQAALFYGLAVAIGAWAMLIHRRAPSAITLVGAASPVLIFVAGFILVGTRVATFADLLFYGFTASALVGGFLMITARHPVHGSLWLLVAIVSTSGVLLLLNAELVAITHLLLHASVIVVLYMAAVMMVELPDKPAPDLWLRRYDLASAVGVALFGGICAILARLPEGDPATTAGGSVIHAATPIPAPDGNAAAVGQSIFTDSLFTLQVSGLLLLTTVVAGVYLTARTRGEDSEGLG